MSGETEEKPSGWTTDTALEYVQKQHDDLQAELDRRMAAFKVFLDERFASQNAMVEALRSTLDERYATQTKAIDAAKESQETAMHTAFEAADKAVQAALMSAEKAVTKAEVASDKRFECVAADTPVLCADLVWRPAGDLRVGDDLVAFDEESLDRRGRRYRCATVTHNTLGREPMMLVVTPEGQVRCTYNHPWLIRRGARAQRPLWRWVRTDQLLPGDSVMHALDVWQPDRSWEGGWLAGMYDGEGCLTLDRNRRTQLTVTQRESPTADALGLTLKSRVDFVCAHRAEAGRDKRTQPLYHFIVTRLPDVLTLLGSVRPPRLLATADKAWVAKPLGSWNRDTVITAIEPAGVGNIARLSTTTRTYLAAGFAMHNSVNEFRQQLSDQANKFMPRAEADSNRNQLEKKLDEHVKRADERMAALDLIVSTSGGFAAGNVAQHTENRLNLGLLIAAGTLLLGLVGTVITLIVVSHA